MKKEVLSDLLIHLWNSQDQAPFDKLVERALRNLPMNEQVRAIESFLESNRFEYPSYDTEVALQVKEYVRAGRDVVARWKEKSR